MITFQSVVPLYEEKIIINHTHSCEHAWISPRCGKAKVSPPFPDSLSFPFDQLFHHEPVRSAV